MLYQLSASTFETDSGGLEKPADHLSPLADCLPDEFSCLLLVKNRIYRTLLVF